MTSKKMVRSYYCLIRWVVLNKAHAIKGLRFKFRAVTSMQAIPQLLPMHAKTFLFLMYMTIGGIIFQACFYS